MSYDISLRAATGIRVSFDNVHHVVGGTYKVGGTNEAWLNVTYNYSPHFYRVLPKRDANIYDNALNIHEGKIGGIRSLYGLTAEASIPILTEAISKLKNDVDDDYWEPTEGNAREALIGLRSIAEQAVAEGKGTAVWGGD